MLTGAVIRLPFYMAIRFRPVHDIAEVKSINTNALIFVADRAAIDARNNSTASLLKTLLRGMLTTNQRLLELNWHRAFLIAQRFTSAHTNFVPLLESDRGCA
jgi:hypothetical protein